MKENFEKRINLIPSEIWNRITQIDKLAGQWAGKIYYVPQILKQLKKSVLVISTGASTRIEGARLLDEDIEKLMKGISLQKFSDRDKQEVRGYYELLENVFNSWQDITFSESTIKHFHKELLKYVDKDVLHRGEYKKKENKVYLIDADGKNLGVILDTTPAYLTPKNMQELVEWTKAAFIKNKYHPLLIISNFTVEYLSIHPFEDGNGRSSRILTNLLLLKSGYPFIPYVSHEKIIEDNKTDYYLSLQKSQKTFNTKNENIIDWLNYFTNILYKQAKIAIELLTKENIETMLSKKQLAVWQYIQTVEDASPKEISQKSKIIQPTVNKTLNKLLKLKKIERFGLGSATRYRKISNESIKETKKNIKVRENELEL